VIPPGTKLPSVVTPSLAANGKAKLAGAKVKFAAYAKFAVPSGFTPVQACAGKVFGITKPKGMKKALTVSGSLAASGTDCRAKLAMKLPKTFKGKKIPIIVRFSGNAAVATFAKSIKYKVK
jgi:hypothetical protein